MNELRNQIRDLQWELRAVKTRMLREIRRLRRALLLTVEANEKEAGKIANTKEGARQHERSVDSDDDFQDPLPRKINVHSKKKHKVDSSTPVAKKPLRKKQVNEHTQTRTPAPRAAKGDGVKTPVFKLIPTRQASSSKMKKEKQKARVIFFQVQYKSDIHVEEAAVSKPESHVEKEAFISKKDFDAFRNEVRREFKGIRGLMRRKFKKMKKAFAQSKDQVIDIEANKSNVDEGGLEQSRQHFSPDVVQSSDNISNDKDPDLQNMDYVGTERSPQRLSSKVDQELKTNLLGKKGCTDLHSKKMNVEIDSQQLIPDELLQSINLDYLHSEKVVQHDCRISDEKIDKIILSDSQFTIPNEMLPSLNAYQIQSIIIHSSANHQEEHKILDAKTSRLLLKIMLKGITNLSSNSLVNTEVELAKEEQVRTPPNIQEVTNDEQRDEQLWPDSQNTISDEFLPSLNVYDQKTIMIYPSANREVNTPIPKLRIRRPSKFKESPYTKKFSSTAVPWHTVEDIFIPVNIKEKYHWVLAVLSFSERCTFLYNSYESSGHYTLVLAEIEKIAMIIPLCLQACDFYVKKGIDLQNHPRYKDKESSNMFDVLVEDDLPQQPSGSLDCGVFMIMYAECLSYGHKVIATEFDPNALRTRYSTFVGLWDLKIRSKCH
ncbi:hypothetical protein T459_01179 [Capsicum annuum]|uniref:Ubiquitin-like protease family profile domain-containing protein n=1 Tax=Capsicum annuum TaxID=4072 RepID=A0A2G3AGE5_CAPAN|nr:hypothetical protein T459_01179 [Capsicum annuum]